MTFPRRDNVSRLESHAIIHMRRVIVTVFKNEDCQYRGHLTFSILKVRYILKNDVFIKLYGRTLREKISISFDIKTQTLLRNLENIAAV